MIGSFCGCSNVTDDPTATTELPYTETTRTTANLAAENEVTETTAMTEPIASEITVEEQMEAIYNNALESTFCIFTSNNNNGTGFLYQDTYIITNAHVLYDTDDFTLVDHQKKEHEGTVIFTDHQTDIAIIQIDDYEGRSVTLGDSDAVSVGEQLVLIGNPAGGEPFSFCTGKCVELDEELQQLNTPEKWYIPTDANIISGYSGGPAFNLNGELIGICNAAYTGDLSDYAFDHLSFLIPINRVIEQIDANLP